MVFKRDKLTNRDYDKSRVSGVVTILKDTDAEEFIDACPNCLTDDYLMDMEY